MLHKAPMTSTEHDTDQNIQRTVKTCSGGTGRAFHHAEQTPVPVQMVVSSKTSHTNPQQHYEVGTETYPISDLRTAKPHKYTFVAKKHPVLVDKTWKSTFYLKDENRTGLIPFSPLFFLVRSIWSLSWILTCLSFGWSLINGCFKSCSVEGRCI